MGVHSGSKLIFCVNYEFDLKLFDILQIFIYLTTELFNLHKL